MLKQYDILVAGEINPDIILSGDVTPVFGQVEKLVDGASMAVGSSSAIFACGAARLGLRVGFIGHCGDDLFGRFMLDEMRKAGVDTSPVIIAAGSATGLSVILARGNDRAILTYPGLISTLKADDISDELLARARHLHVASYFLQTALQPGMRGLFERAHSLGLTTSLDTNYDPSLTWAGVKELLPLTNVFLPNEVELCSMTHKPNLEQALEDLAQISEILVVKQGALGGLAVRKTERVQAQSPQVKVQDTVGAGDSFDAGFLYGYLNQWSLEESIRLAVVCGSLSTQAAGGTAGQPTLAQAREEMGRLN
jgi:sugar/nucleoside kinase (ribokinase family)